MFVGSSPSCPKVVEYGGNTHGFGSRSVLGKGWPKDIVKVLYCFHSILLYFHSHSPIFHSR